LNKRPTKYTNHSKDFVKPYSDPARQKSLARP